MTAKPRVTTTRTYRVANPRGIPPGRYIIRVGDRVWFEGDIYDGPLTDRLVVDGFVVEEVT